MNPAPGTSWPDLHYVDTEQVELDVSAIIARGTRLRRRRLITKVAATALIISVAPAVAIADMAGTVVINGPEGVPARPRLEPGTVHKLDARAHAPVSASATFGGLNMTETQADKVVAVPNDVGFAGEDVTFSLARARVRSAATLSHEYGPLLAIAGARASSGIWFTATAAQLTLFHLSMAGALRSWALPASGSVRASGGVGVGLAVTPAGLAWIGAGSTLVSLNTNSSQVRTWRVPTQGASAAVNHGARHGHNPTWPGYLLADSVAVSPDGHVAVATSHSSRVQVLDPRDGMFRPVRLPGAADQALAVGYARDGTLGIGYWHLGKPDTGAVLLVSPTGRERSTSVAQPTAVAAYGASGLLVGVTKLAVVSAAGRPRPLLLPAGSPEFTSVTTPPAPLPGDRLAIATDTAILTFPATATSATIATDQSQLWVTQSPRCQPRHGCPAGYLLMATDEAGDVWVVPKANPRAVEVVSLR